MIDINNLDIIRFPGGELHIKCETKTDEVVCRITSSDDFMRLALYTDAHKHAFGEIPHTLILPYFPYARQDRVANEGEPLSVKVFANLINSLGYKEVRVLDPHSDVTTALVDNIKVVPQHEIWGSYINNAVVGQVDLISPDAGALKKIYKLQSQAKDKVANIRIGTKHRDTMTGQITGTSVDGKPVSRTAIIVDDICDGGRTFIELAKVIRQDYDRIELCVTHGIFSKGMDVLFEHFDTVVTTNSFHAHYETCAAWDFHVMQTVPTEEENG